MADRVATTTWDGDLTQGSGTVHLDSSDSATLAFSLPSRAGDVRGSTNPEELVAAAHSSCYSMQLSALLTEAGTPPERIVTRAVVTQGLVDGAYLITRIVLTVRAAVPGADRDTFLELAEKAKRTCPVSVALRATDIGLDADLVADVAAL